MPFTTPLDAFLVDQVNDRWELHTPLVYTSMGGQRYAVPAGFRSDLSSIPRLPLVYMLLKRGDTHRAGVLHDYLCRYQIVRRGQADALFYEALRSDGVGRVRAWLMWAAVATYTTTKGA